MARHRFCGALLLLHTSAFMQPPRTTLKPYAIDAARRRVSLTAAPNEEIDVQRTLATLIAAQVVLFVGVGAVIPVVAIYGRETLGLSAAASGVVVSAPALALLLGAITAVEVLTYFESAITVFENNAFTIASLIVMNGR